ncbi:protein FAR1-RELATED SEQUENCE 5-like [Arachis ipaensis]|uniref:protein FAR1-RELATED SEQUENCE 5-like n=1 Tax=Arachis ipaensis TaxID=130454 RepID=UPI0007AF6B79|nr:protein FAR1-RELATED SEQUENCE 5-like [Arachis ipaensis]
MDIPSNEDIVGVLNDATNTQNMSLDCDFIKVDFGDQLGTTIPSDKLKSNRLAKHDFMNPQERLGSNTRCAVDEQFVPKVGMIFKRLEEAGKFYKYYSKLASFSTKIRNTTRDGDKIKNQLIVCSREGRWKSKISPTLKTNPSAGINCPARIYVHILKDVGLWTISKVVLNHSHPCCPDRAEMLKQHRELSMFVCRTIETNEEAKIRPSKTYQSFIAVAGSHWELSFIEKDVRNYITREVRNVSEQDDAKEFRKYLLRMKENNQNLFFELNLEGDHSIKHAFWADTRSRAACEYFGDVVSFNTTYNTNRYSVHPNSVFTFTKSKHFGSSHYMKIPNKLNGYKRHEEIEQEMSHVIWNSFIKDAFDKTGTIFSQSTASDATSGSQLNLLDDGPTIQPSSSFHNALDMYYPGEDYTSFSFY